MTGKVHWRCFHCGETFTLKQERWAREHFGRRPDAQPVCLIRTAGEAALLSALRKAEDLLESYRREDGDILRAMWSMQADHASALRREEERGYNKGVVDARVTDPAKQVLHVTTIESLADALARAGEMALPIFGRKVLFRSVKWEAGRQGFTADMTVELQAVVEVKP